MPKQSLQTGYLVVLLLVFGSVFFVMITSFAGYIVTQSQVQNRSHDRAQALAIAEAGLDYYKWFLAHYPNDLQNGTTTPGPYVHTYQDPEGGTIGEFSLDISGAMHCGETYAVDITSTGHTYNAPSAERIVYGRYARPTVAEYAYIINSNVWAGSDRTIIGPYHSNGIVRMDGTNNSTVTSGQESWQCDGSIPCSPHSVGSTVDAVYGDGPDSDLWQFPAPPINFTGLTVDLADMQDKAENEGGLYIGPSGDHGYRLNFQADGTVDVYVVDRIRSYYAYNNENGWHTERHIIRDDDYLTTYSVPAGCSVIFVEDKVWLEGTIDGLVTLAVADVDTAGVDRSIVLHDDILYNDDDSGLLAIAEEDVSVGLTVPNTMEVNGIFIAQNGRFGRNHYSTYYLSWAYDQYVTRSTLTINGTIVSNGRVGTKWNCGGSYCSGFATRYNSYDRDLVNEPPPLTPRVSDTYEFTKWREEE